MSNDEDLTTDRIERLALAIHRAAVSRENGKRGVGAIEMLRIFWPIVVLVVGQFGALVVGVAVLSVRHDNEVESRKIADESLERAVQELRAHDDAAIWESIRRERERREADLREVDKRINDLQLDLARAGVSTRGNR